MFQFRAFPSYAYLIQRTIHRYCLCGFPHSEISGSTDICSSPKLIAACHVLRRLLMPRHSPCALYSLTKEIHLVLLNYAGNQQVTSQNCNCYPHLFRCSTINRFTNFFQLSLKDLSVALLFITFFIVQFSRYNFQSLLRPDRNVQLLCASIHLQFRGGGDSRDRTGDLLLARQALSQLSYIPIYLFFGTVGGPEWARTTDLTIISRTL